MKEKCGMQAIRAQTHAGGISGPHFHDDEGNIGLLLANSLVRKAHSV